MLYAGPSYSSVFKSCARTHIKFETGTIGGWGAQLFFSMSDLLPQPSSFRYALSKSLYISREWSCGELQLNESLTQIYGFLTFMLINFLLGTLQCSCSVQIFFDFFLSMKI